MTVYPMNGMGASTGNKKEGLMPLFKNFGALRAR
jgi:hypothetical protein